MAICRVCGGSGKEGNTGRNCVACAGTGQQGQQVCPNCNGRGCPVCGQSASAKLLKRLGLSIDDMDIIEFNEAFAAQALASARELGLKDDDARLNPQGGAIALGHPLGMSGTRLLITATKQLERSGKRYALCAMCVGVGQGIAMVIERYSERYSENVE